MEPVEITDIHMKFTSMVVFMIKWALATIPAIFILIFIIYGMVMLIPNFTLLLTKLIP